MRPASKKYPGSVSLLLSLVLAAFIVALLVVLVLLALIYHPAAAVIGAALVPVLFAAYKQFVKLSQTWQQSKRLPVERLPDALDHSPTQQTILGPSEPSHEQS